MSNNTPDVWVILELSGHKVQTKSKQYHRVLAGWFGGYTTGESWKINSGIESIEDHGDRYVIHGSSGSVYNCVKNAERTNAYTQQIFESYAERNTSDIAMSIVPIKDIISTYTGLKH